MYGEETKAQAAARAGIGAVQGVGFGQCFVTPERDTPEVIRVLNNLSDVVDRYENIVLRLQDRLSCVTSPAPPENCTAVSEKGYMTELANLIDSQHMKLHRITNGLESILARIEL